MSNNKKTWEIFWTLFFGSTPIIVLMMIFFILVIVFLILGVGLSIQWLWSLVTPDPELPTVITIVGIAVTSLVSYGIRNLWKKAKKMSEKYHEES